MKNIHKISIAYWMGAISSSGADTHKMYTGTRKFNYIKSFQSTFHNFSLPFQIILKLDMFW